MSYKRILVPVDGGTPAARGMAEAVRLAKSTRARLMLLHVVDEYPALSMPDGGVAVAPMIDALKQTGRRVLDRCAKNAERSGVKPQTTMVENPAGSVSSVVIKQAKRWKADLIVVGSASNTGVKRALMGSDAESIARESPVPVLIVPSRRTRG